MAVGWWELVKKKMGPGPGNHRSAPSCKFGMYCKVVDRMVDKSGISRYVAMASHIYIVNYIGLSLLYTLLITLAYHISKVWQCVRSQISTDIPILKYPTNKGTTSDNEVPFIL